MANEVTVVIGLSGAKSGMNIASGTRSQQRTMNGANMVATSQLINGTSNAATQVDVLSLSNVSEVMIYNRDNTAAINVGTPVNMASVWCQVAPLSSVLFQPPANTNAIFALSQNASSINIATYATEL
jgi:hypothetical protein